MDLDRMAFTPGAARALSRRTVAPAIYLAGPINGCTDAECKDWRTWFANGRQLAVPLGPDRPAAGRLGRLGPANRPSGGARSGCVSGLSVSACPQGRLVRPHCH